MKLLHKVNISEKIFPIKNNLTAEIISSRHSIHGYSFLVNTMYKNYLYDIFIQYSRKILNSFTITNTDNKIWSYVSDESFQFGDVWHNHMNTATINGVIYLETVKKCGLEYSTDYDFKKIGNIEDKNFVRKNIKYFEPQNFDLIIFPNFLNHRPLLSKKKRRISINLELICKESSIDIFKI